jgi:hypothetical protein
MASALEAAHTFCFLAAFSTSFSAASTSAGCAMAAAAALLPHCCARICKTLCCCCCCWCSTGGSCDGCQAELSVRARCRRQAVGRGCHPSAARLCWGVPLRRTRLLCSRRFEGPGARGVGCPKDLRAIRWISGQSEKHCRRVCTRARGAVESDGGAPDTASWLTATWRALESWPGGARVVTGLVEQERLSKASSCHDHVRNKTAVSSSCTALLTSSPQTAPIGRVPPTACLAAVLHCSECFAAGIPWP